MFSLVLPIAVRQVPARRAVLVQEVVPFRAVLLQILRVQALIRSAVVQNDGPDLLASQPTETRNIRTKKRTKIRR